MPQVFGNNVKSTLLASITNVATTLTVPTADMDKFPTATSGNWFLITVVEGSNIEVMRVTARTAGSNSMTVTRAQEAIAGTAATAFAFGAGAKVELRATEETFSEREEVGLASRSTKLGVTPTLPFIYHYARTKANAPHLAIAHQYGDVSFQPSVFDKNIIRIWPGTGAALGQVTGMSGFTTTGTLGTAFSVTGGNLGRMRHTSFTTSNTAGSGAGFMPTVTTDPFGNFADEFFFAVRFHTTMTSGSRFFAGMTSRNGVTTLVTTSDPSTHATTANGLLYAGLLADAADTNLQFSTKDGAATITKSDTGVAKTTGVTASSFYGEFFMFRPKGAAFVSMELVRYVQNTGVVSSTTGVVDVAFAGGSQIARPTMAISNGAATGQPNFAISRFYLEIEG